MKHWFDGVKSIALALVATAAVAFFPMSADAHMFMLHPGDSEVEVGSDFDVVCTYTENTNEIQYALNFMDFMFAAMSYDESTWPSNTMELKGSLVYNDGTVTDISDGFEAYDDPDYDYISAYATYLSMYGVTDTTSDCYKATATAENEGTIVVEIGLVTPMGGYDYISHSKQIINLTNDGLSNTTMASLNSSGSQIDDGNGIAEIVPLTDLAYVAEGDEVEFQLLLCGEPREGEMIQYATETGEITTGSEGETNLYDLVETDSEGKFTYTPTAGEINTLAVMFRSDPDDSTSKYYSTSVSFELLDEPYVEEEEEEAADEEDEEEVGEEEDSESANTEENVDVSDTEDSEEESEDTAEEDSSGTEEDDASDAEESEEATTTSSPGGGGCNAGFGGLALLALALVTMKKREK